MNKVFTLVLFGIFCLVICVRVMAIDPAAKLNPYAWITSPADGATFHPGDRLNFSGNAEKNQGNGSAIPSSDLCWTISEAGNDYAHLFKLDGTASGSWTVPEQDGVTLRLSRGIHGNAGR